jgi:hypothetical protein
LQFDSLLRQLHQFLRQEGVTLGPASKNALTFVNASTRQSLL